MDITTKTVEELKVMVYDFSRQIQALQSDLQVLNQEIVKREQPVTAPPAPVENTTEETPV